MTIMSLRPSHATPSCGTCAQLMLMPEGISRVPSILAMRRASCATRIPRISSQQTASKRSLARLNNPDVQIIDARTPQEFAGEDIRAIRGGHIPGAINIPYEHNWVDPETPVKLARKEVSSNAGMSLKRTGDLKQLYSRFDPRK